MFSVNKVISNESTVPPDRPPYVLDLHTSVGGHPDDKICEPNYGGRLLFNGVELTGSPKQLSYTVGVTPNTINVLAVRFSVFSYNMLANTFTDLLIRAHPQDFPDPVNVNNLTTLGQDIYEFITYTERLDDTTMEQTISYLNKKYEIYETDASAGSWQATENGGNYSPNSSSTLPYTTNLNIHLDSNNPSFEYNTVLVNGDIEDNIFTYNNHGLTQNQPIYFNNNFAGVSANKLYMTDYIDTNTFKIKENINDTNIITIDETTTQVDLSNIALYKLSSIENLFTINTKLQNIINPFKKYIVTEINNQYYIDGIANKFIELTKDQTIMFDLSALTDRTKFEIVNNHFTIVAINTNDDTNFVFNYTGTENTLYYVKSNYKSKDTINFGNGSTPAISSTTTYRVLPDLYMMFLIM